MKQVQFRGGTTQEHLTGNGVGFVGLPREITIDTSTWTIRVHDGITIGGFLLAKSLDVYTKEQTDIMIANIVSGGTIDLGSYATITQLNTKANIGHTHTEYSPSQHLHAEYSPTVHEHAPSDISFSDGQTLLYKYENKLLANVDMEDYITRIEFDAHTHANFAASVHEHSQYSPVTHSHEGYSPTNHTHINQYVGLPEYNEAIGNKAQTIHTHTSSDIILPSGQNLDEYLNGLQSYSHNHDDLYYKKEEINDLIISLTPKRYEKKILITEWEKYIDQDIYFYNATHNLNSLKVNVVAYVNNKIQPVDIAIPSLSEVIVTSMTNEECDIIVTVI